MAFFGFPDADCFAPPDFSNYLKKFRPKAEQDEIDREQNERIAKLEQGGAGGVGADGGYYSPNVDNDGNLTWTASADNMPAVTGANIKGPQGNKGETGATGAQGPAGADGQPGADGVTPNIQIGAVETLAAGSDATASITGTAENPLLNLGIPKGADGTGESITDEQAAQIEQNTADITDLKSDLSNLSDVTAESVETTVEVETEIEYSEENTDCRFTLNSNHTKVATSTSALANYTSIVCDVQEGKTYRIKGFKGSDLRYRRMWAFTDDSANVISASEAGNNTTVTEDATCPSGATKLYVNCASGDGSVALLNATTKIEYTSKSYTKAETDEKIETHISEYHKHKTCVLMNFDASPNFVSDGRKSLLDQYRIPYTVNISISADGVSATYPGSSSGANYIADIIKSGNDFALYSASSTKPDEDADIYNGGDDSVALFETYVREAITIAENYGVFNPTAWFCRYMRTGTAMNQALINCGIKICRGYKYGVTPAESTNEYIKNWNNHDKQYFNINAQSIKSHGFEDGETSETSIGTKSMIDTAIENGWDIAPFAHGIYDTAEEAEENNGITKTLFENVLAYIRQKIDAGECEAMTFRDYYRTKYPADGGMNDIARERKYSDFKLSQII